MKFSLLWLLTVCTIASSGPIEQWNRFEKNVRDQVLPKDSLTAQFPAIADSLKSFASGQHLSKRNLWIFPLKGYAVRDIGKGGFKPDIYYGGSPIKGYDFFDGNKHGGHPAYDIFIRDRNHDCRDDGTGMPVEVIAPEDMLVLSVNTGWTGASIVRGGNYVWGYIPEKELFLYFAHMDSIAVTGGTIVRAGQPIGTIGRSGRNAASPKSPTHLHMMVLRFEKGRLQPVDFYGFLTTGRDRAADPRCSSRRSRV